MKNKIQKDVKNRYNNYYITSFILLIVITLISVQNVAQKKNEDLLKDHTIYQQSKSLIQEGDYTNVIYSLKELIEEYPNDYNITYRLGNAYLNNGKFDAALTMYTRSLDLNPYLVENKNFMYHYAIVLSSNEQYDNAILVIGRLQMLPIDESFESTVTELKNSIDIMRGSTI